MKPSIKQEIKICCICSVDEANEALKCGANAIGLVANMPSGPGIITDEKISEIVNNLPQSVNTFLLTSFTTSKEIIQHHQKVKTKTIQIVDELTNGTYDDIRNAINGIRIVQVIHVIDEKTIDQAIKLSKHVDAILLDSGNPNSKIKTLGGTGKTHNWGISKIIREEVDVPIYLAGGLTPENVKDAINSVKPFGVDVCSGVRTDCKLDKEKLIKFISEVHNNA